MSDSFFTKPGSSRKRSRPTSTVPRSRAPSRPDPESPADDSDDFPDSGSDEEISEAGEVPQEEIDSDEEFADETAADKRRRLAKQYLENLRAEADEYGFDAQDLDDDIVARRLKDDTGEARGRVYRFLAGKLLLKDNHPQFRKTPFYNITAIDGKYPHIYVTSKDITVSKWQLSDFSRSPKLLKVTRGQKKNKKSKLEQLTLEKVQSVPHTDEILTVAVSPDGKYVCTGGRDRKLVVWSAENLGFIKALDTKDRRGVINAVAFRRNTDQLYAACADLKIRTYSIDQLAQMETLFGHQDNVLDISALGQERCVTVGSRDKTAMLWKIVEETRLTFRGGDGLADLRDSNKQNRAEFAEGSMDCVTMIDDTFFVTGSDNGNIALWSVQKKKPVFIQRVAHGVEPELPLTRASAETDPESRVAVPPPQPYWITAVYAIPYTDLFFSGSWDGNINVWQLAEDMRSFSKIGSIPTPKGVVNGIRVLETGAYNREQLCLVAALAKEMKHGRWKKIPGGKNGILSCKLELM